ncbi:unnamed protein product [Rotaria sp. Silwood2]|nr:unnamed protein product [Rotaria sp. Silwood2]CAF2524672.1 unnamed protein product [Rotaria sp. Silwood2]
MERLNTIKFKLIFDENCRLLNDQMHIINESCSCLYQSNNIKKLLEIILSVVNHLNPTVTHRVLTLDDLSKILDLKTSQTRIPIMNIVSKICIDHHSEIFDLKQNYKLILSASKIDLIAIKSEIEEMKQQFEQIQLWKNRFEENIEIQNKPNANARAPSTKSRAEQPFSPTDINILDDSYGSSTTGTGVIGKYDTRVTSAASSTDTSLTNPNEVFAQATLQAINGFRRRYEAPPLDLNDQLSEIAQRWAEQMASTGKLQHSPPEWRNLGRQTLGETYAASFQAELTGEKMVRKWMKEGKRYMFGYDGRKDTENFTQLVWRASQEIGAGRARSDDGNWWYGVVIFDPPGNIPNQYADNVHLPAEIK